ncbi:MAG TPA: histidine--tRNA ligase [Acidimicrobiales bacterium]|nr:histidine--tRNA ligase [Acidimicrobiales bacterium]
MSTDDSPDGRAPEPVDRPGARAPEGTHDVLAPESWRWRHVLGVFAGRATRAGYGLVISPMFEHVSVFLRGLGEEAEVVNKEMYEFTDRGGRAFALRPEGTASIVRAFVQHHPVVPWKAWYATPAFRDERPQGLRFKQHHQLGVEVLGTEDPDLDVEVIDLAAGFYADLGLARVALSVSSMGDARCRPPYVAFLRQRLDERRDQLCDEHRDRFAVNPLRVLDCKRPECVAATADLPGLVDSLCEDCQPHFDRVLAGLDALGLTYVVDKRLVRGFDYYTRTTFEFAGQSLEVSQNGIGGGGRYGGLAEALGGPPTPGIGFGIGIERVLGTCDAEGVVLPEPPALDAYVVDTTGGGVARDLVAELRRAGLGADRAFDGRSMKSQMKSADRSGAAVALIVGPAELAAGTVALRPLRTDDGDQLVVPAADVVRAVGELAHQDEATRSAR